MTDTISIPTLHSIEIHNFAEEAISVHINNHCLIWWHSNVHSNGEHETESVGNSVGLNDIAYLRDADEINRRKRIRRTNRASILTFPCRAFLHLFLSTEC